MEQQCSSSSSVPDRSWTANSRLGMPSTHRNMADGLSVCTHQQLERNLPQLRQGQAPCSWVSLGHKIGQAAVQALQNHAEVAPPAQHEGAEAAAQLDCGLGSCSGGPRRQVAHRTRLLQCRGRGECLLSLGKGTFRASCRVDSLQYSLKPSAARMEGSIHAAR